MLALTSLKRLYPWQPLIDIDWSDEDIDTGEISALMGRQITMDSILPSLRSLDISGNKDINSLDWLAELHSAVESKIPLEILNASRLDLSAACIADNATDFLLSLQVFETHDLSFLQ